MACFADELQVVSNTLTIQPRPLVPSTTSWNQCDFTIGAGPFPAPYLNTGPAASSVSYTNNNKLILYGIVLVELEVNIASSDITVGRADQCVAAVTLTGAVVAAPDQRFNLEVNVAAGTNVIKHYRSTNTFAFPISIAANGGVATVGFKSSFSSAWLNAVAGYSRAKLSFIGTSL